MRRFAETTPAQAYAWKDCRLRHVQRASPKHLFKNEISPSTPARKSRKARYVDVVGTISLIFIPRPLLKHRSSTPSDLISVKFAREAKPPSNATCFGRTPCALTCRSTIAAGSVESAGLPSRSIRSSTRIGPVGGEAHLVAVQRLALVLDDDVGVVFEDRDDLVAGFDLLSEHDAPVRLIFDSRAELEEARQLRASAFLNDDVHRVLARDLGQLPPHLARILHDVVDDGEKLAMGLVARRFILRVANVEDPALGSPEATAEPNGEPLARLLHQPSQHVCDVPEQRLVARLVDVRLDDGAVRAHRLGRLDALDAGEREQAAVDRLESLGTDALDVALQCGA